MAIEKRIIRGQEVGFDTKTNSYCNLPADFEQEQAESELMKMTKAELTALAAERSVDLTGASTKQDIVDLLEAAEQAEKLKNQDGQEGE